MQGVELCGWKVQAGSEPFMGTHVEKVRLTCTTVRAEGTEESQG